jgi:hypothetical protein
VVLDAIVDNVWLALLVWASLFTLDYVLTLRGARLLRGDAGRHLVFHGGYELTPLYRQDVATLRSFSPRFVIALVIVALLILFEWLITHVPGRPNPLFEGFLGFILLMQAAVHFRHLRNLRTLGDASRSAGVRGQIEYSRWFSFRASAVEILEFAGLFALIALLTERWFFVGGALGCALLAVGHWQLSRREPPAPWKES